MALLLRSGTRRQFENSPVPFKGTNTVMVTDEKILLQIQEDGTIVTASLEETGKSPAAGMMETEVRFDGSAYWINLHGSLYRATVPEAVWGNGIRNVPGGAHAGGLRADAPAEVGPKP